MALSDGVNDGAKRLVVATLCRSALEAAAHERIRADRLLRGQDRHADVEALIARAETTHQVLTLALLGDQQYGRDLMPRLNAYGRWAGDAFMSVKHGAHDAYAGDLPALIRDVARLAERVRS